MPANEEHKYEHADRKGADTNQDHKFQGILRVTAAVQARLR